MWIPYDIRASLKAESDTDTVRLSVADVRRRDFLVGFYLRNPVTQAWELDVLVADDAPEQSGAPDLPEARVSLHGNERGKLAEVIYRLPAATGEEALTLAYEDVERRLLRWQVATGRGMAIAGWRIADLAHQARWRCTAFRPSALALDDAALGPVDADLAPLAELFRRARNAPDPASRLMAAFALLDAAVSGNPALARSGAADFRVTQEILIHSGGLAWPEPLADLSLAALVTLLRPHHDRLLGPRGVLAPAALDLPAQKRLAVLANLADLVAHRLLISETRARAAGVPARSAEAAEV
ncbi:hypothetical protein HNP73_001848 [Amaricoccus macauensis]|uniref:Methylamine utilization protein MauJ n=1 Tax=Amaricoccus macauensis TaxID=57001 RepID=A0A840SRR4_9RHOB|nr:methylamine utilization protein MauJ [Amaricoccus macauensis]MBB5221912.1 hypothetical protein [Amaricoccus macauensis]